ncbi:hypothetical protein [Robertmurraya andreesenii]|uniref:ABC-2 family transporter protein n=1 Tax=Anoxybacillus andreesenii TaxID=1325932 RepID=A0ABT9V412_9BACL|nr:hypothetical protein [Robertmurraya andreesenii]MDQ0155693.1 hypothetical protein [Robertmurraya andreesenii]
MSLVTANLMETVKKQYGFKLKANIDAFSSLVGIQLLAILFSLNGSGSSGTFSETLSLDVTYYSADIVVIFTMIWALVTAITITTKPYRSYDFTFVTNRLSSNLSNMLFLLTASLLGTITAVLSRYLIQVIGYFIMHNQVYLTPTTFGDIFLGIAAGFLYIFCISAIGYLIGTLVQVNKLFVLLVPGLIIGSIFLDASMQREPSLMGIFQFYLMESSILLFAIKMLLTTAFVFGLSFIILNRMEVRR